MIGLNVQEESFPIQKTISYKSTTSTSFRQNRNSSMNSTDISSPMIDINSVLAKVNNGKKSLPKKIIKNVVDLYKECGSKANHTFYNKLCKISGVGDGAYCAIKEKLGNDETYLNVRSFWEQKVETSLQSYFVYDNDVKNVVKELKITDKSIESIILDDIDYIQKYHRNDDKFDNEKCFMHLKRLLFSSQSLKYLDKNAANENLVKTLIDLLRARYRK